MKMKIFDINGLLFNVVFSWRNSTINKKLIFEELEEMSKDLRKMADEIQDYRLSIICAVKDE